MRVRTWEYTCGNWAKPVDPQVSQATGGVWTAITQDLNMKAMGRGNGAGRSQMSLQNAPKAHEKSLPGSAQASFLATHQATSFTSFERAI